MADRVHSLSDAELRATLRSYGLPNIPIGGTTRQVLVRKLMERMNRQPPRPRPATLRVPQETPHDSDDTDSEEETQSVRRNEEARKTITWVECWLLLGLAFIGIHIMTKNTTFMDAKNSVIPICHTNTPGNIPGINCVVRDQVSYAKDLLKLILPELKTRVEDLKCGKTAALPYLSAREIYDMVNTRTDIDIKEFRIRFSNLKVLLEHNPSWGFSVMTLTLKRDKTSPIDKLELDMDNVVIVINLDDRSTPLFCLIFYPLHASSTLMYIALMSTVMLALHICHDYCRTSNEDDEFYSLLKEILLKVVRENLGLRGS